MVFIFIFDGFDTIIVSMEMDLFYFLFVARNQTALRFEFVH